VRRRATRRYKRIHKGGGKLIHTLKPGHRNIAWNTILEIGQCYIMYNNVEKQKRVIVKYYLPDTPSHEFIGQYTGVTTLEIQGNKITFFNFITSSGAQTRKMVEFGPNEDLYTADGTIFFSKVDCEGPKAGGRRIKKKRRTRKKKRTRKKRTRTRTKRR